MTAGWPTLSRRPSASPLKSPRTASRALFPRNVVFRHVPQLRRARQPLQGGGERSRLTNKVNQTADHENEENPENAAPTNAAAAFACRIALRAKATANSGAYDKEDYEAEEEPNMKFSHALLVVLALHVIAVGGVFAFNSIKAGQAAAAKNAAKEEIARAVARTSTPTKPSAPDSVTAGWQGRTHTVQAGDTLSRLASLYKTTIEAIENENGITTYSMIRVGQVLKIPARQDRNQQAGNRPSKRLRQARFSGRRNPTCPSRQLPRLPNRKLPNRPPSPPLHRPSLSPNQPLRLRRKSRRRPPMATPTRSPRVTTPTASPRNCT